MGVKICPKCGGKVSDSRKDCMHCGYIFAEIKETKVCPDCEEILDINIKECPTCGYAFEEDVKEKVEEIEIEDEVSDEKYLTVAKIHKGITKEQFLRNVFIELSRNEKSPSDILTAEFGEVEEDEVQFFAVYGTVNGYYTATIGYDRYEKFYVGDNYRTKTVTTWQPFNGNIVNYKTSAIVVEPQYDLFWENFNSLLSRKDLDSLYKSYEEINQIPDKIYSEGIESLRENATENIHIPGDRRKDFHCTTSISDYKIYRCIVPIYKVIYYYKGEKFIAEGLAIDGDRPVSILPSITDENEIGLEEKKEQKIKKTERLYIFSRVLTILSVFMFFLCLFGSTFISESLISLVVYMCIFLFVVFIILKKIIKIIVSKKVKQIKKNYEILINNLKKIKSINLYKKLEKYGFEKLNQDEEFNTELYLSKLTNDDLNLDLDSIFYKKSDNK